MEVIYKENKKDCCYFCKVKQNKIYKILNNKKDIDLCDKCLKILYEKIGEKILPKSPTTILKKDNRINKSEYF